MYALAVLAVWPLHAPPAAADVERVEVLERTLVADGKSFGKELTYLKP